MASAGTALAGLALSTTPGPAALAATPQGPAGTSAFHPLSVTFASLSSGWALGTVPCPSAGACLALRETTSSGRTWAAKPLPARLAADADRTVNNGVPKGSPGAVKLPASLYGIGGLQVRFANALDGWIFGALAVSPNAQRAVLWSTHNGGQSWRQIAVLPGQIQPDAGAVLDLEAAGGTAYLMAPNRSEGVTVESTPVGSDKWHADATPPLRDPAGGGQQGGAFLFEGGKGWLIEGNDRGVTGSAELVGNGKWSNWAPPCADVGNSFLVPAASNPDDLVAVCQMGGFAYPLSKSAPPGATLGSYWLYFSRDGGSTFSAGPELGRMGYQFGGLLASPSAKHLFLSYGSDGSEGLLESTNGGRSWGTVYKGNFFYLGFTSPSQGVGLLRPSSSNTANTKMIMTFDGGKRWAPVQF